MHIDDEVTARTAKASVAYGRLRTNVWERNGIRLVTKLKVYKADVLPTLLYACETWTVYQRHAKKLNHFHLSCLRKLLKIRWQDKIPDTEVLKKAKMQSVYTLLYTLMHIDDEVTARTAKASVAFGRLRTNVWERNGIRLDTKLKVYKAVVLPTLLYACGTWTVYQRHAKKLDHFHLSCLRKILKIRWQDKIPDPEVLKKAKMQSVYTLLKLAQLCWTGHVTRMPDERLPKKVLYGEQQEGKRSQGGQSKRYKDTLKASLKDFNIPTESWEQAAQDRTKWRCLINKGASQFEAKGICEAERKRK